MIALVLVACTFAPGRGWGELTSAALDARYEPGAARDLGDGRTLTNLGYEVTIASFVLDFGELELLELQGGGSATFDPANPPPGYTLCHGGHCHSESGALVDYADVAAELAGDDASFSPVVRFPVDAPADLVAGASWALPLPDEDLGAVAITKTRLGVSGVALRGEVSDGAGWTAPLDVALALDAALEGGIDLVFGRDEDPSASVGFRVSPGGTVFDDLDFTALATESVGVVLDDALDPGAEPLLAAILAVEPVPTVTRSPWSAR